ncbi:MAG: ABC transporter substrate-binding protein [Gammaproteobacteria bacterium]|nr:MAG: ABC transporter substrate-binding protein [Gammaproteobacteria bacterium]
MKRLGARAGVLLLCGVIAAGPGSGEAQATGYTGSPSLVGPVARGELPLVDARLPENPAMVKLSAQGKLPGRHGGTLRLLMGRTKDVRLMVVYGYARLVGYDESYQIRPDILERIDVVDDKEFTLHLRRGHRWSDGRPFTSEDFRYYWEDTANNPDLSPFGAPNILMVNGKPPTVEIIDDVTVRYRWDAPNPFFLPKLAGTRPLFIYSPAHYLKQFHAKYADARMLAEHVEKAGVRNWAALHNRMDRPYKNNNPDLPSLQPWVNSTRGPSEHFVFVRNSFFHRVDENGLQLPYIDTVVMNIAAGKLIAAKTGAGESDLQARHLSFSDYTFLKKGERRSDNRVHLWQTTKGSHIALYPNMNAEDDAWRKLIRDVRFRRALSMAIDRHELNQVIYYGLATEGNNSVHERSPLYRAEYRKRWAHFDLRAANALLDDMGLTRRDRDGIRQLPDGRAMVVVVETAGEDTEQTDVLELIHDSWLDLGIKLFSKPMQREVFRNRVFAGKTLFAVWGGLENGVPTADMSPRELAPTNQQHLQWPKWGQYFQTKGKTGEAVDMPAPKELLALSNEWVRAPNQKAREAIWHRMLATHADQVYTLGLIAGVPQPVVVNRHLRNVPEKGVYNWEPGAHFGFYRPDTFWFDNAKPIDTQQARR